MKKIILIFIILQGLFHGRANSQEFDKELKNEVYNHSACGLDIIHKSVKISGRRPEWIYTTPNPMPATFNISELPDKCYAIEKAIVWWVISDTGSQMQNPKCFITNPQNQSSTIDAAQTGAHQQKGYGEYRTRGFRADVTDQITTNGSYKISVNSTVHETDGITLLIVYKNYIANPMYEGHIVIRDGLITGCSIDMTDDLEGINACDDSFYGKAFLIASDLQWLYRYIDDYDTLKHVDVVANGQNHRIGRNFWNAEFFDTQVKKGQQKMNFQINEKNDKERDCYSWITMGVYYRTPPCSQVCPEILPVRFSVSEEDICPGDGITLEPGGADTYEWKSIPAGFTSNEQTPTVFPEDTTVYIVKGILGSDCIHGYDTIRVNVMPELHIDAGPDTSVCPGRPVLIGNPATGGVSPYTYEWSPATGLSNPFAARPQALPEDPVTYYLTVTDFKGCIKRDTIFVDTKEGTKPEITADGVMSFCPCDSVLLDAGPGFVEYRWSSGDSTRSIYAKHTGEYIVSAKNEDGCWEDSEPVYVDVFESKAVIRVGDAMAAPGGQVEIPIYLEGAQNIERCNFYDFYSVISFNKTALVPVENYPYDNISGERRFIGFNGRLGKNDEIGRLKFIATLGEVEESELTLERFEWLRCPTDSITKISGEFVFDSLCEEGGLTRLFYAAEPASLSVSPNPLTGGGEVVYNLNTNGRFRVYIIDLLGREVRTIVEGFGKKGEHTANLTQKGIPQGQYIIILETPDRRAAKKIGISK